MSDRTYKTCDSCQMRYRVGAPLVIQDGYAPIVIDARTVSFLENAARLFDEASHDCRTCGHGSHRFKGCETLDARDGASEEDRCQCESYLPMAERTDFTAEEFVSWLKPDITGKTWVPDFEGIRRHQGQYPNMAHPLPFHHRKGVA